MKVLIDGGSTSTKVYFLEHGKIVDKKIFQKMNIKAYEKQTIFNLQEIIDYLLDSKEHYEFLNIGIPGINTYDTQLFYQYIPSLKSFNVNFTSDVLIHKSLFLENQQNFILISLGTGSVILENVDGVERIIGGWGHFFGDEGSSYDFSINWIKKAIIGYTKNEKNKFEFPVMTYFKIQKLDDIKFLYSKSEEIKIHMADFAKYILVDNFEKYEENINVIVKIIIGNFIKWIKATKLLKNKKLQHIYIFGGLLKNNFYQNSLVTALEKITALPIKVIV